MFLSIFIQVGGRYVFNYPIAWTTELATYSQVWLVILGAGLALKDGMHAGIDMLVEKLNKRIQLIVSFILVLLSLAFLLVTIQGSKQLLIIGQMQTSAALGIPMHYVYIILPVGFSYIGLELIVSFFKRFVNINLKTSAQNNETKKDSLC